MPLTKRDVLDVRLQGGEIRVDLGIAATNKGTHPDAVIFGSDGFISMPNMPSEGEACVALFEPGPVPRVIALKDNRCVKEYGELAEGDRAIVSVGPQKLVTKKENASVNLITANINEGNKMMLLQLDGQEGALIIYVEGNVGSSFIKVKSDSIAMVTPNGGSLLLDADGVTMGGNWCAINTGGGNLGTIAGTPPVQGANSILLGVSGITGMPAPFWVVSPS